MMKKPALSNLLFAALCCSVLTASANASVLYDNLNSATLDGDSVQTSGPLADSFSTGAYSFALNQVVVKLNGTPDGGSLNVLLLTDSLTSPGAVIDTIGTLSDTLLSGTFGNFSFTLSTPFLLAPNSRYWIELTSTANGSANWAWSYDVSGQGVTGEYVANSGGVFSSAEGPYQMQVAGSYSAPEPSSLALLGAGLVLGVVGLVRRKLIA